MRRARPRDAEGTRAPESLGDDVGICGTVRAPVGAIQAVILVVASQADLLARWLVQTWSLDGAALLTPASLSVRGWQHHVGTSGSGRLAIGSDRVLDTSEVQGVYTRLSHVREEDLPHIVASDRAYVAAEMTAFLRAWLSHLPCTVVNRPTSTCLAGPYWRPQRWAHTAAHLGIPIRGVKQNAPDAMVLPSYSGATTVTVVGERWFGDVDDTTGSYALTLARASGTDVLQTLFESDGTQRARFLGADLWPDLTRPLVAEAIHQRVIGE